MMTVAIREFFSEKVLLFLSRCGIIQVVELTAKYGDNYGT